MIDQLWKNYFQSGAVEERDALIVHYLHLVKTVVGRVGAQLPSHVNYDDLYSSGVQGLIRAVERYDIDKKAKFESYASLLIKGAIIDELRKIDWIPRSVHQKIQKVKNATEVLSQKFGRDPLDEEMADYLEMSGQEYEDLLNKVRPLVLLPLNAERYFDEEEGVTLAEVIADEQATTSFDEAEKKERSKIIEQALMTLKPQEQKVMKYYYYDELMLKEIAKKLGITESRVSQIHTTALMRLKFQLEEVKEGLP